MKKFLGVFILVLSFIFMAGCTVSDKTYFANGFEITMQDGFYEKSIVSATTYFESEEAIVLALKEDFTALEVFDIDANTALEEYLELVIYNNKMEANIKKDGNIQYITYENGVSGKDFFYLTTAIKSDDAFWLISFACEVNNKAKYEDLFLKWSKTIKVK